MKLSCRLHFVLDYIYQQDNVIDVGTDHAQLPIYLIKNQLCNNCLAIDNKIKPLKHAQLNIDKHLSSPKVKLLLSNGFSKVTDTHYNVAVITGLGIRSVVDILKQDLLSIKRYIIMSHSLKNGLLRQWITKVGYFIEDEKIIKINNLFYELIIVNKHEGTLITSDLDIFFGPVLRYLQPKHFITKWQNRKQLLLMKQHNLIAQKNSLTEEIKLIEQLGLDKYKPV